MGDHVVRLGMAIALPGIVMAGVGCTSTTPQARVADEVAAQLGPQVASALAAEGADPIQVLWRAVDQLDPPEGVDGLAAGGSGKTHGIEDGRDGGSVSVVVEPDIGDPYCIIVGVDPDGANEGVPATGDASAGCVHAAPIGPTGDRLHGWPVAPEYRLSRQDSRYRLPASPIRRRQLPAGTDRFSAVATIVTVM